MPECSGGGVYNATHGLWDLAEAFLNLCGVNTRSVALLQQQWDEYFANCPDNGIILHECHSHGAIITRNALRSYDPEKRKRIHVLAIAPAAYIDDDLCGSIRHIVSKGDIVHRIDMFGWRRNSKNVIELPRHKDAKGWIDHSLDSPTFRGEIQSWTKRMQEKFGVKIT